MKPLRILLLPGVLLWLGLAGPTAALEATEFPLDGVTVMATSKNFKQLIDDLRTAIKANKMGWVTAASASKGNAARGVTIAGNMVVGVFRPDYAKRMLEASVASGIEAPIRYYITENADGTATLSYRAPSAVFAPYRNADLDAMAAELDPVYAAIAAAAAK